MEELRQWSVAWMDHGLTNSGRRSAGSLKTTPWLRTTVLGYATLIWLIQPHSLASYFSSMCNVGERERFNEFHSSHSSARPRGVVEQD